MAPDQLQSGSNKPNSPLVLPRDNRKPAALLCMAPTDQELTKCQTRGAVHSAASHSATLHRAFISMAARVVSIPASKA